MERRARVNIDGFYHRFKTTQATHGMIEFYNSKDEDLPFRRLEFWDGWISELSETMTSTGSIPMLLYCEISPATVRYNKSLVFQKNWFITDINQKQVKEETEEPLQVLSIKGNTEVVIGNKVDYSVEKLNREATKKEKNQIHWAVEINNDKMEYLKDTGEKIEIKIKEEWRGFNIRIHAYTEDIDDAATLEAITIKYFKKNPKISGLTSQPDTTTCVITVMEYVSEAVKGTAYSFDYYLNLYMNTYLNLEALNPLEKLRAVNAFAKDSGIDLNNMEAFINKCFETVPDRDTVQNINNGYPVICVIRRGVENGHCLAIIGYTSDKRIVIIDPERTEKNIVNDNNYIFYKSISKNKTIK